MRSFESMGFLKSWLKNNQLIILNKEASDFRGFCFCTLFASHTPHVEKQCKNLLSEETIPTWWTLQPDTVPIWLNPLSTFQLFNISTFQHLNSSTREHVNSSTHRRSTTSTKSLIILHSSLDIKEQAEKK